MRYKIHVTNKEEFHKHRISGEVYDRDPDGSFVVYLTINGIKHDGRRKRNAFKDYGFELVEMDTTEARSELCKNGFIHAENDLECVLRRGNLTALLWEDGYVTIVAYSSILRAVSFTKTFADIEDLKKYVNEAT